MNIQWLGEQLSQLKQQLFAKVERPEVGPAMQAQPPINTDKEAYETKMKNLPYGMHKESFERYSIRFPGLEAVFEEKEDRQDSLENASVKAEGSPMAQAYNYYDANGQLRDADLLIREPQAHNSAGQEVD